MEQQHETTQEHQDTDDESNLVERMHLRWCWQLLNCIGCIDSVICTEVLSRDESLDVEVTICHCQQEVVRSFNLLQVVVALLDVLVQVLHVVIPLVSDVLIVLLLRQHMLHGDQDS